MTPFTLMISFSDYVPPTQTAFDSIFPGLLYQRKILQNRLINVKSRGFF